MPIILDNLTHVYGGRDTALRGVSLTVEDGEYVALIGHTGCGKTTLVQHLQAAVGFTSYTTFYRIFSKQYGVSPVDYRNYLLEKHESATA